MKTLNKLKVPVIQGGMGVGISMGSLAGHVARNGGMGVISTANIGFRELDFWENTQAANERALRKEIAKAKAIAGGEGMLAINAMVVTSNYHNMVRLACEEGIDAVISGAGLPLDLPEIAKDYDVLIAPIVSSGKAAAMINKVWKKRYDKTPDFIVVEGSQAGGHLGFDEESLLRETTKALADIVREVKESTEEVPVFAAGSVFDKKDFRQVKEAGAFGVQMATCFIATEECDASKGYKDVILSAKKEDVTILKSPVGMPGRGIKTPLIERIEGGEKVAPTKCVRCIKTCNPSETPFCINKALIEAFYGNYEEGLFFAGSNVGRITEMTTVSKLMQRIAEDWRN